MKPTILCFGEVLWDCLPDARLLGGAPLNVAYHAACLGAEASIISCVGEDELGAEALERIRSSGVSTEHIGKDAGLPTGTVQVELSPTGQPSYDIVEPVAWDRIPLGASALAAARKARAIVFGSLAARSETNRQALDQLLALANPTKVFDVNLRPPYDDVDRVLELARRSDVVKMNDVELAKLSGRRVDAARGLETLEPALEALGRRVGVGTLCATCGPLGAVLWSDGNLFAACTPPVTVADTVGAGDAFTAALTLSLLGDPSPREILSGLERACSLGALVCSLPGAQPGYDPDDSLPG